MMIKNFYKIAWRNLIKNKLSSFINIFGLTLGISVCIVILIFVHYESTFDAFHDKSEETFRVVQHNKLPNETLYWNTTAYPLAEALRNDFPQVDIVTQIAGPVSRVFKIEDSFKNENLFEEPSVLFVDNYYPKTFDVEWLAGDKDTALRETASVVLTEKLANRYFGLSTANYQNALGKTILLQSKDPLTVTGVIKSPKGNSDHQYNMLIPYEFFKINNPYFSANWSGNYQGTTYVVLNEASQKASFESKITNWKSKYLNPQDDKRISYHLQPLTEVHNETIYGASPGGYIMPKNILNIASVVALFIFIIALINFVNLVTAQSNARSKEVGVRKVMGGSRANLTLQFVFENAFIILFAAVLSIVVIQGFIQLLNNNLATINLQLEFEATHLLYILFAIISAVVLGAVYPAIILSGFKPIQALKNKFSSPTGTKINLRKSLVTFQFVMVQLFVIAAIILAFQMNHFKNSELGFHREAVVITESPDYEKSTVFREKLLANGGISKVSYGSGPPMAVNGFQLGTNYRLPEQSEEESMDTEMKIGDLHYLDFFNLELLAGRNFLSNKEAFDEFIVNETFLASFGWKPSDAIGKKIQINEGQATIVGVVKDFHNNSLQYEITPCILLNWTYYQNNAFIKMSDSNYTALNTIKSNWEETYTNAIYDFQFLDDGIAKQYMVENMIFTGFGIFSVLSILIGCLGLFGLMSFIVAQKRKEIGIRKVLGASILENISFFTKEYFYLVLLSFIIATPIVYYFMNLWLESFTYRIQPSFWMFLIGGLSTFLIAMVTCSFQSIKASRANPIIALREE
ncbi:ABC transporter permease [Croceitalea sp. MTPC9]|nr:ABC transporter permease [Croceitalea sp. MTPC6]GMN17699.1 ABC transporter permease [Croceitalea sp. MTPC9]